MRSWRTALRSIFASCCRRADSVVVGKCTFGQLLAATTSGLASTWPLTTCSKLDCALRGRSSAGRASGWQPEGQGFEPPRLHTRVSPRKREQESVRYEPDPSRGVGRWNAHAPTRDGELLTDLEPKPHRRRGGLAVRPANGPYGNMASPTRWPVSRKRRPISACVRSVGRLRAVPRFSLQRRLRLRIGERRRRSGARVGRGS